MEYDPIKDRLAKPMRKSRFVRRTAYKLFELGFLRVRHVKRELRRILKRVPEQAHFLDAGFGFGPYTDYILRHSPDTVQVTGIEVKADQVEDCSVFFASEGYGHRARFRVGDLVELDETDRYNAIVAVDIMEHIEDDVRVLRNFLNALRPGGILLIHTPSGKIDSRTQKEHSSFVGEHVRDGYHPDELVDKLREAGFSKIDRRFTYGRWGMKAWWMMQGIPFHSVHRFKPTILLLPIYYLLVFPFAHRLMVADMAGENRTGGGGLLVVAEKEKV